VRRILIALALLTLAAPVLAGVQPTIFSGRTYLFGNWAPGVNRPDKDITHYPYRGYLAMFGTDTAYSVRMFCGAATGRGFTLRLVGGTGDTTRIDSTGIYTTGMVTSGGSMVNSDSAFHKGYTTLGDSVTDYVACYGQFLTRNRAGTSNWATIKNPASLVRGSQFHFAATLTGMGGSGQFNELFVNAQMETAHASASIRGAEIKGTTKATLSGTAQLIGAYLKTTTKNSATSAWTTPCYSVLDIEAASTVTLGYNFYAENANAGTVTAAAILGTHPTNASYTYGCDFNDATFETADLRLQNGATIQNGHADTLTVTETVLKWSGLVFVNGKLKFGSVSFDSASHGVARDTVLLWAHDTAYAIVKRP